MIAILIGLALIFLDLNLTLASGAVIDVLPDVLGYIIALFGLRRMGAVSYEFSKCIGACIAGGFASGVMLGMTLFPGASFLLILMELIEIIMQIVMLHFIVRGIRDAENEYSADLYGKWLRLAWAVLSISILLSYTLDLSSTLLNIPVLSKVSSILYIAAEIGGIAYLAVGYFTKVRMDEEAI